MEDNGLTANAITPQHNADGFPQFARLPTELRYMIWKYVAPEILPLPLVRPSPSTRIPIAGCFQVNREARQEIARCTPFYFDIHQREAEIKHMQQAILDHPCLQKLCELIRNVVVCRCELAHFGKCQYRRYFPALRKVYGITVRAKYRRRSITTPENVHLALSFVSRTKSISDGIDRYSFVFTGKTGRGMRLFIDVSYLQEGIPDKDHELSMATRLGIAMCMIGRPKYPSLHSSCFWRSYEEDGFSFRPSRRNRWY
ncbi:hypothetical protein F4781DRAFT_406930 [Annulohypoxylon bovei var. microspora]|nr:hypothetical protein F4781DRAFT_406930 [Annulohypoxylon bovei var. microspora]